MKMFKDKLHCKKLFHIPVFIVIALSILNCLSISYSMPVENKSSNAITLDLNNNEDTLKSLEELIETVRKIRADSGADDSVDAETTITEEPNIDITTIIPIENSLSTDATISTTTSITTTTEALTTTTGETTTTTTTTTAANVAASKQDTNLLDLESSFGGLGNVRDVKQPEKLNGFYFLADINSFLEVGDGDEKVVVRFNPKIGNPSNFISVPRIGN